MRLVHTFQRHVALDFGGSGTRLARWEGWSLEALEVLPQDRHRWLWGHHPAIVERLARLVGAANSIGVSFSGRVDPATGCVLQSDRLGALCGDGQLDLQALLQRAHPDVDVRVINDGTAAALGAARHLGPAPLLVLILGTWPIVRVVDAAPGGLRVDAPEWLGSARGELRAAVLRDLPPPARSRRVAFGLAALLHRYQGQHRWKPSTVALMGGGAVGLLPDVLSSTLAHQLGEAFRGLPPGEMPHRLWLPRDYLQQARLSLVGARLAAEGGVTFRCG